MTPATLRRSLLQLAGALALAGVLAAVGVRRLGNSVRDSKARDLMRATLHRISDAQEAYFRQHRTYTATPDSASGGRRVFDQQVTVRLGAVSDSGWSATARYEGSPAVCAIHVGTAPPPLAIGEAGRVTCVNRDPGGRR